MNHNNHQNLLNNQHNRSNGTRTANSIPDEFTHTDAVSPRFRTDLNGQEVTNFCYSCKSEFTSRSVHDLIEHYSQPHERFSSYCLYCKTGKVHQYKSDVKGLQFYHDCYRSKMNYDKWVRWSPLLTRLSNDPRLLIEITRIIKISRISLPDLSSRLPLNSSNMHRDMYLIGIQIKCALIHYKTEHA